MGDGEEPGAHAAGAGEQVVLGRHVHKAFDRFGTEGPGVDLLDQILGGVGPAGQVQRHAVHRVEVFEGQGFELGSFQREGLWGRGDGSGSVRG